METGSGQILPMKEVKLLIKNVSWLLHTHWDPIGLNDDPERSNAGAAFTKVERAARASPTCGSQCCADLV